MRIERPLRKISSGHVSEEDCAMDGQCLQSVCSSLIVQQQECCAQVGAAESNNGLNGFLELEQNSDDVTVTSSTGIVEVSVS